MKIQNLKNYLKETTNLLEKSEQDTNQKKIIIFNATMNYLIEEYGLSETIEYLYEIGFSSEDLLDLGFEQLDIDLAILK